jgi:uncharacterized membrane protein (UPF0127 family)
MYRILIACALLAVTGCSKVPEDVSGNGAWRDGADANTSIQHLRQVPLRIVHAEGGEDTRISVEIAMTPEEQELGLMHRTGLKVGEGMIFPMMPPRMPNFWMKDTPEALDIVFIRTDGSIARIVEAAQPGDKTPIFAEVPVSGVLELKAGSVSALRIDGSDNVSWGTCAEAQLSSPVAVADNFCPG